MEHRTGKGHFTVAPIEGATRVKRTPENPHPELDAPTTFVDLWLAQNPASQDEALQGGISARKTAAMIPEGGFFGPFTKEAKEIAAGIKKYGSLEAFERATANVDYFADCPEVPFKDQLLQVFSNPTPTDGSCFQSHLGSEGVHRVEIQVKKKPEFVVTPATAKAMETKNPDLKGPAPKEPLKSDPKAHLDAVVGPQPSRINPTGTPLLVVQASEVATYKPSQSRSLKDDFDF